MLFKPWIVHNRETSTHADCFPDLLLALKGASQGEDSGLDSVEGPGVFHLD